MVAYGVELQSMSETGYRSNAMTSRLDNLSNFVTNPDRWSISKSLDRDQFNRAFKGGYYGTLVVSGACATKQLATSGWRSYQKATHSPSIKAYTSIHWGKQNKHIPGSHNFIPGESKVIVSSKKLESLLEKYAGTGKNVNDLKFGQPNYRERINFGEVIGKYVNSNSAPKGIPTSKGIVIYDKQGRIHMFPSEP